MADLSLSQLNLEIRADSTNWSDSNQNGLAKNARRRVRQGDLEGVEFEGDFLFVGCPVKLLTEVGIKRHYKEPETVKQFRTLNE